MKTEPSRVVASITAAATATVGLLTATGTVSAEIGGAITVTAAAWILAAGEIVRSRVTPTPKEN